MKITFVAPRAVVDMLVSRAEHQAVLLDGGEWLCVADVFDDQLRDEVLAAPGVALLPARGSRLGIGQAAIARLRVAGLSPDDSTQDAVARVVGERGMPSVLAMLDRNR